MTGDYHIHHPLCGHAEGEPRQYVERALELGMREMGFSDHLPMIAEWAPGLSMTRAELERYAADVSELAAEYRRDIRVLFGGEADYFAGAEEAIAALLGEYPFDYVIGSVHFVGDGFGFDQPWNLERVPEYGVDRVFLESYELVARAAASGLFRIVGHLDLPRKSKHAPRDAEGVSAAASRALSAIAAAGTLIEINTAGWRFDLDETFPAPALLREASGSGIGLTIGSDAHRPEDVGRDFARARELARETGFAATVRLSDGAAEELA